MECINHQGVQAAGTCSSCSKGLCSQCVSRFEPPLCEPCLVKRNNAVERRCYTELGITAAIFIVAIVWYLFSNNTKIDAFIFFAIVITCAYWGRGAFNAPSNIAVDMKTHGFFSLIRLVVAIVFGLFIAPFAIYKRIREIQKIRQLREDIASGRA